MTHSVLFDVGPEEDIWERNVKRLRPDLASVEVVQLSHWHRDHSGELYHFSLHRLELELLILSRRSAASHSYDSRCQKGSRPFRRSCH